MPGVGDRAPAGPAQDAQNQRHGGAIQRAHRRCPEDPPLQQPRRSGADVAALCGLVQPPAAAVSLEEQDAFAGNERLASNPSAFV